MDHSSLLAPNLGLKASFNSIAARLSSGSLTATITNIEAFFLQTEHGPTMINKIKYLCRFQLMDL